MAEIKLTPEAQQILMELQTLQQQIQTVLMQKESLNIQNMENEKAMEELNKIEHDDVYKAVGPILIKSTKNELKKELSEKKETIELRLKSLQKQESRLKEKMKESQERFEEVLKSKESKNIAE